MSQERCDESPLRYDFHLTDADETRSLQIHRESIVFDMLSQHAGGNIFAHYPADLRADYLKRKVLALPAEIWSETIYWPFEMSKLGRSHLLRDWLQSAGLTCGTFSDIRVHDGHDAALSNAEAKVLRYSDLPWVRFATTVAGIRQAKREGAVAFYANCQPSTPAPRALEALDRAYAKGLRSFMLTYNRMDHIGVGCTERVDAGLSMFGVEVVAHCNDLGIMVDVSHCGHATTLDACRHSKGPVNANHTTARQLYNHARGKNDEELRAIADTGGVIGVLAAPSFLIDASKPTIEHMLDHIDYIADLIGWRHVAIGTDWPLQLPDDVLADLAEAELKRAGFRGKDRIDATQRLIGFDDCRDLPNITRGLVKRGYGDEEIRGILGENALRVFEAVCG